MFARGYFLDCYQLIIKYFLVVSQSAALGQITNAENINDNIHIFMPSY